MKLARARAGYSPTHVRVAPPRQRSYGGFVVLAMYVVALALNEWRLQRTVVHEPAPVEISGSVSEPLPIGSAGDVLIPAG